MPKRWIMNAPAPIFRPPSHSSCQPPSLPNPRRSVAVPAAGFRGVSPRGFHDQAITPVESTGGAACAAQRPNTTRFSPPNIGPLQHGSAPHQQQGRADAPPQRQTAPPYNSPHGFSGNMTTTTARRPPAVSIPPFASPNNEPVTNGTGLRDSLFVPGRKLAPECAGRGIPVNAIDHAFP